MLRTDAARHDRFLGYLEERIREKRVEYAQPGTSARSRDILETEIAEVRAICRTYREQFLDAYTESH